MSQQDARSTMAVSLSAHAMQSGGSTPGRSAVDVTANDRGGSAGVAWVGILGGVVHPCGDPVRFDPLLAHCRTVLTAVRPSS